MNRSAHFPPEMWAQTERRLLAALLRATVNAPERAKLLRLLGTHAFADADCHVVYRALAAMPALDQTDLRPALIQAVTRLGFPDLDLDAFFSESPLSSDEIAALLDRWQP